MEYDWKCFLGQKVRDLKSVSVNCRIKIFGFYFFLLLLLVLAVVSFSYAAEPLTPEQAVNAALANNPRLKTSDSQIESADAGVLRSASGFLSKVTLSAKDENGHFADAGYPLLRNIENLPVPTIASLKGETIGWARTGIGRRYQESGG